MTKKQIIVWVLVILVLLGLGVYYVTRPMTNTNNEQVVACTLDAKVCPDGSSVGRVGPKCEFAACPTVQGTSTVDTEYYPADIYK